MTEKTPQQTSDANYPYPLEEETSFIDILGVIVKKKGLILLVTFIFIFLSICYYFFATPKYKATISFLPPPQEIYLSSIDPNIFKKPIDTSLQEENEKYKESESSSNIWENLNNDKFLYRQFLTRVQSFSQQKEIFLDKNIFEKFFGKSPDLENIDQQLINLHNKISLKLDVPSKPIKNAFTLDKPANLEMEGSNSVAMAEFLNVLTDFTKSEIIKETQYALQTLAKNALKRALDHKDLLLFKAKKERLKKIQDLSDSLKIAKNLNIKNNNFHLLKENDRPKRVKQNSTTGLMKLFKDGFIPKWFLYGEKALNEELRILNSRTIDDNYIEEIVSLETQIRQLRSFDANNLIPNVTLIEQPSIPPTIPINLKIEKIFPIGIGLGLLFGLIAAFLSHSMELLRNKNTVN